jgi:RNA polymerase primary sigma factor
MRKPTIEEISAEIGISKDEVKLILGFFPENISLEYINDLNESNDANEFLADFTYSPERELLNKSSREATLKILNSLKDREKSVLIYRYQLNGEKFYTLKKLSYKMGISVEAIRQLENRALVKLKKSADELRFLAINQ